MILLHNIGDEKHSNYNTREQILACNEALSFDGVYRNVWENREILKGKDVILFVGGDTIGGDNAFDLQNVPKLERFCSMKELDEFENVKLGWHTWSHRDLTTLSDRELRIELSCPSPFRERIAYPYGKFDERVIKFAKEMGFKEGYSVTEGDGSEYQKLRKYL